MTTRPPRKETVPFAPSYREVTCHDCAKLISRHHAAPLGTLRDVWRCGPCDIAYCKAQDSKA